MFDPDQETDVEHGEEETTSLSSLNDDKVKLIAYTIVSLKRGKERIMPKGSGQMLVTENMDGRTFASWMIARYLQSKDYQDLDECEKVSKGDEKYLRVDYVVRRRWPRQPLKFEERQVELLREIGNPSPAKKDGAEPETN
jgi:hypothetical protein